MTEVKILYVEDHDGNIYMMGKWLQREGYETIVARDGAEAIAMAGAHKPDLILMDLNLPVTNGLEATRQIKAGPETRHIPIIALSGFAMYDDREKALAAGCDEYYAKPIDFQLLRARIEELLTKGSEA
jgi:two-component system cell cycle response regulator DivK